MLIRAAELQPTMSHYLADRVRSVSNIEVVTGVEVDAIEGTTALQAVVVKDVESNDRRTIPSSAMFIFIGVKPHTDAFSTVLARDEAGFILTAADLPQEHGRPQGWPLERAPFAFETNIPGVFAAGDVRSGANRRVAAAVGEGSAAIYSVQRYLRTV